MGEDMNTDAELTEIEQKIFDRVKEEYIGKGITPVDGPYLKRVIKLANVDGDGYKRVTRMDRPDRTYLVPIEDIILYGIKAEELDKYPVEGE